MVRIAALAGVFAIGAPLGAQAPAGAPTREEINRAAPPPQALAPSRLTLDDETPRAPCPLADVATPPVTLRIARFDHLRGLAPEQLRPAYEALVGKALTGADLCAIRDAASEILRRAGYIAAVSIPAQDGADGDLRFDIVMARIVRIEIAGRQKATRRLAAYLAKLTAQPVFNLRVAERYLLLARDLPGYDVHLTLRSADAAPGDVVGIVSVGRTPIAISANLQNYGSHELGRWGALVSAQLNDLVGLGDRLTLGLFNTLQVREQTVLQGGYDLRVGGEGAAIGARATYAWTRPELDGDPLSSRTLVGAVEASYPIVRRQSAMLRVAGGLELIDQDLRQAGLLETRDRLRVVFGRLDFEARAKDASDILTPPSVLPRWRIAGTLEARRGLGILGATKTCGAAPAFLDCSTLPTPSRLQADPEATLIRLTAYSEVRAAPGLALVASSRLQYAFAPLASYEQYSGGAYTIGRGYDPGAAIGDSGAGVTLEAQYGSIAPRRHGVSFQPFVFLDSAWAWNRAVSLRENDPQRLFSTGGGVRIGIAERARVELSTATPLRRGPYRTARGGTRVLLSLTTRLWP